MPEKGDIGKKLLPGGAIVWRKELITVKRKGDRIED